MDDALSRLGQPPWRRLLGGVSSIELTWSEPPIPQLGGRVHSQAGELARIINGSNIRFIAYVEFLKDAKQLRGNHYHERKREILYIMRGSLHATYKNLDSGEHGACDHHAGELVAVPPRVAHVYQPITDTHALELSLQPYDANDTIPFNVMGDPSC
jgi:mannose-6-phosphate isomerase-like protein (cupin superfamily)